MPPSYTYYSVWKTRNGELFRLIKYYKTVNWAKKKADEIAEKTSRESFGAVVKKHNTETPPSRNLEGRWARDLGHYSVEPKNVVYEP